MSEKLTKPQQSLLDELPTPVSGTYEPAKKLVALGLARWVPQRLSSDVLVPTEKGVRRQKTASLNQKGDER